MNDFLGDRSVSFDGARLNLSIEAIGDFLDIQCGHLFLRNESSMEERKVSVKRGHELGDSELNSPHGIR